MLSHHSRLLGGSALLGGLRSLASGAGGAAGAHVGGHQVAESVKGAVSGLGWCWALPGWQLGGVAGRGWRAETAAALALRHTPALPPLSFLSVPHSQLRHVAHGQLGAAAAQVAAAAHGAVQVAGRVAGSLVDPAQVAQGEKW